MIGKLSEKITVFLLNKDLIKENKAVSIDCIIQQIISATIIIGITLLVGILCGFVTEVVVISVVLNVLRQFSGGYHSKSLENCTVVSTILIIVSSYISKITIQYASYIFFISIFLGIYIIIRIPKIKSEYKNHDDKFYRNGYVYSFLLFYLIAVISQFTGFYYIINAINFGIATVVLTILTAKG